MLPVTRDACKALHFQGFKKVSDYNSTIFRIVSQLKFCGMDITDEEMLDKTYSIFHVSNITLQQQYRLHDSNKYFELILSLLIAEKNNKLLIKNHQSRPIGSATFSEANDAFSKKYERGYNHDHGRGRERGRSGYYNTSQG